jgi:hypothetical protein
MLAAPEYSLILAADDIGSGKPVLRRESDRKLNFRIADDSDGILITGKRPQKATSGLAVLRVPFARARPSPRTLGYAAIKCALDDYMQQRAAAPNLR